MNKKTIILQLESASIGTRELDAGILASSLEGGQVCFNALKGYYVGWTHGKFYDKNIPNYTTCIETAFTLISDEWSEHGFLHWPGRENGKIINEVGCTLHHLVSSGGGPKITGYGATWAIAICIAALKAYTEEEVWNNLKK